MDSCKLEDYKKRLWDRYITIRAIYGIDEPFENFWYEFLARHYVFEEQSTSSIYHDICESIERRYVPQSQMLH